MPSAFATKWQKRTAQLDRVFGEPFVWSPMVCPDVNARAVPDPDRPEKTIAATWSGLAARAESGPAAHQGVATVRAAHASSRPFIDFDLAQLPYAPRVGDRVERVADHKLYHAAEPRPDGMGRVQFDLNEL